MILDLTSKMTVQTHTAFFYGTLIHPAILRRVIGHSGPDLQICPALLLSKTIFQRDLSQEENSVRGSLVTGLSDEDVRLLDIFEGDEYSRDTVSVYPLASFTPLSSSSSSKLSEDHTIVPDTIPSIPPLSTLPPPISAQTYVWVDPVTSLEPRIWEYADFVRDSAWKWVGSEAQGMQEYVEVDKRREMGGKIVRTEIVSEEEEKKVGVELESK
ncbi:mitochondrial Homoaconitase [Steccherinum ochraceum]|uniref:Putative gamma-glutamylcyclotransferase n=1 Tax=Steccherinum ochraceum TaxID=92696 RepID=A0A4R0RHK3_9APHY|nr:mitochondrial Homoaconitase [Steccherinum ochraceum]